MGVTLYEGLADDLRRKIARGVLKPGDRVPSEAELQRIHSLSRHTVRQAMALLNREGLVESRRTRGWWVRDPRPLVWHASRPERNVRTDLSPVDAWSVDVRDQGKTPSEQIAVVVVAADQRIASHLHIPVGAPVVARKRVRHVDGEVAMLADTYYPHDLVAGSAIAQPGDVLPGAWAVMASLGHAWDDSKRIDEIRSRSASKEEAGVLGVEPGHAVTEIIRTRRTTQGRPVAVAIVVAPGDRVVLKYGEVP